MKSIQAMKNIFLILIICMELTATKTKYIAQPGSW